MEKTELIKGILKLGEELDKDHGMGSVMIIDDMQRLVDKYVEQLSIPRVVKSLPTDEEIYSEGCNYVRKIEQPNRQPLITLRRTFKAGAEFVKKQLDN